MSLVEGGSFSVLLVPSASSGVVCGMLRSVPVSSQSPVLMDAPGTTSADSVLCRTSLRLGSLETISDGVTSSLHILDVLDSKMMRSTGNRRKRASHASWEHTCMLASF